MNCVDFVIDFCSHISAHVSQTFASCTHNTSYSLLNFVHVIVCVHGLTNHVWKIPWVLCKNVFCCFKNGGDCLKSKFLEKLGLKFVFWESISSHTHAFALLYSMFWGKISKNQVFSLKSCFFQNFDWSNLIFDQSKSCFKNSVSLCLVRLIEPVFRSIEHRISGFLKTVFNCFKHHFQKVFQLFFSLSPTWQGCTQIFCRFLPQFLQGFPLSRPLLLVLFSCFHAFKGYFWTSLDLGFLLIQCYFSEIDR